MSNSKFASVAKSAKILGYEIKPGMVICDSKLKLPQVQYVDKLVYAENSDIHFLKASIKTRFNNNPDYCPCQQDNCEASSEDCDTNCLCLLLSQLRCCDGCTPNCNNRHWDVGPYFPGLVYETQKYGFGMKSIVDIESGSIISPYLGIVTTPTSSEPSGYAIRIRFDKDLDKPIKKPVYIDASLAGNCARFVNHACKSYNCRFEQVHCEETIKIFIVAIRKILKGEEMLVNYGSNYFKDMKCLCRDCVREPNPILQFCKAAVDDAFKSNVQFQEDESYNDRVYSSLFVSILKSMPSSEFDGICLVFQNKKKYKLMTV